MTHHAFSCARLRQAMVSFFLAVLLLGARQQCPAAVGGGVVNTTFTTSTSHHETHVPLTVDQRTSSGVIQNVLNGGDRIQLGFSPGTSLASPRVQAALQAALRALPPFPQGASLQLLSRTPGSGGSSSKTTQFVGTNTSVTTTTTFGPATILIGPDQSQTFFVAAGTLNINTNTHTQSFFNDITTLSGGAPTVENYLQQRIITIDLGSVFSALDSGLPVALALRDSLLAAHAGGIGDVNDRILRAWLGPNETGAPQGDKSDVPGAGDGNIRLFANISAGWLSQGGRNGTAGLLDTRESASAGAEWKLRGKFRLGVSASQVHSETDFSGGLGSQHIDGGALSAYVTWRSDASALPPSTGKDGKTPAGNPSGYCYADLLYSAGLFSDTLRRNTLTGATARSTADDWSHLVSLNAGYVFKVGDTFATGPYASLTYVHGRLDGSTESGGGAASLTYGAQEYDSLVSTLGWQANWKLHRPWGALTPLVHIGWERENLSDGGAVSATLLQSPFSAAGAGLIGGFRASSSRADARYDALVIGAAVSADIGENWTFTLSAAERTDFGPRNDVSLSLRAQRRF